MPGQVWSPGFSRWDSRHFAAQEEISADVLFRACVTGVSSRKSVAPAKAGTPYLFRLCFRIALLCSGIPEFDDTPQWAELSFFPPHPKCSTAIRGLSSTYIYARERLSFPKFFAWLGL